MAEGLYAAQERDPNTCRQIAIRIGLDPVAYDREVKNPDLETVLNNNQRWVRPTDLGLPFFWVQDELVVGAPKPEDLDRALQRAKPAS